MDDRRREAALVPVLVLAVLVVSVVSSLGAPLIPSIAAHLHVSLDSAQWSLTVTLLSGAVTAPVIGRLGDGPRRRAVLIGGLAAVTTGGVIAALAPTLGILVVGRALQGIGVGLVPLTMAAARDHLPHRRVPGTIAVLSVVSAAGVGAGYPLSGLVAGRLGVSAAFWFGAAFGAVTLVAVAAVVPPSTDRTRKHLDVAGAVLLTAGLVALLVAVAEGADWGWSSGLVLGLLAASVGLLAGWACQQLRARDPLVELRLLRRPAVLSGNACAMVVGVAVYMYLTEVTEFVQVPRSVGGFESSAVVAGLCLVPMSVASLSASRTLPWLTRRFGQRGLLPVGSLLVGVSGAFYGLWHGSIWQAFAMMAILGAGMGLTYAAIPGLILRAVPPAETGSAMGFYQVIRYVGFSFGSALAAAILAGHTAAGSVQPAEGGYVMILWVAVGFSVAAALLAWVLPIRPEPDAVSPAVVSGQPGM